MWASFVIWNNFFVSTSRLWHVSSWKSFRFSPNGNYLAELSLDKDVVYQIPYNGNVHWNSCTGD